MWIGQGVSLITDMGVSIPEVDLFAGLGVATILIVLVGIQII